MKKNLLGIGTIALCLSLAFSSVSCNSNNENADTTVKKTVADNKPKRDLPNFRYVDVDTVLSRYNLAKDYNEEMLRMQNNFESTARQKQSSISSFENQVQQKMQNNGYLSEASLKQDQQKYVNMTNAAQNEMAKMQQNMQNAAMQAQQVLNDSIQAFIKEYNAKKGYDAILYKAATLYIDPALDITDEVVKGLNDRYNKVKK